MQVGITVVLTVAGEVLGATEYTLGFMQTVHVSLTHGGNHLRIVAVSTEQNFFTFPVIGNIHNGSKSHIAAGSLDLCAGHMTHGLGIFGFTGSADLHLRRNKGAVGANTIAALLRIAGDKCRNLGMLLNIPVLIQNLLTGHAVVAAAAQMVGTQQMTKIFITIRQAQLPEQLSNLFFVSHGCDGVFYPCNILIIEVIRHCS